MILSVGLWRSGGWDFTGLGPEEGLGHTAPEREKDMWVVVKIKVPFLGTLNNRCRIKKGTQKGTITLTTTHIGLWVQGAGPTILGFRA